ncbi:Armadillo-like helical [Cynara cardunculus var. scolymus]|uniref:Armadillo-like helical n=2 Tax=Cynara cardunculus var. scolymus TaxID=59895 RepID=A0A118K3Y3_CYNCS|nr:Armadillo-like helical [Cynara cardunculus var. scolymus]
MRFMMLRRIFIIRPTVDHHRRRCYVSNFSFSSSPSASSHENSIILNKNLQDFQNAGRLPVLNRLRPNSLSRFAIAASFISAAVAASYVIFLDDDEFKEKQQKEKRGFGDFTIDRSNESLRRILDTMKHTGIAVSVLLKSLSSVLSSANHEVRSGFEGRVASLLADIVAADETRRAAIVGAGGGMVLDWLLDSVALNRGGNYGTQAESARALAYLIADSNVSEAVLGRPHAIPNLLKFIFSAQPHPWEQQKRPSSFGIADPLKGRSMLIAAIMDIVTSNCDNVAKVKHKPMLSGKAAMRDIAAALQVVEEGGMYLDERPGSEDDGDDGTGLKGIGIKVLGGTTIVGLSRRNGSMEQSDSSPSAKVKSTPKTKTILFNKISDNSAARKSLSLTVIPGLWDDLHSQHVAVPFAAWALANWAMASDVNRSHIQELDHDGNAIMNALVAPERSVKWHGSLVARLLLEDQNLPSDDFVPDWGSSLLSTVSQASRSDDIPLTQVALSAFLLSIERCPGAQKAVMEKNLYLMRETAKRMKNHESVQEALAKGLELLCTQNMHLSLEEGEKWSSILLQWVFGDTSLDATRSSAIKILSHILEDYAPSSIPISQGWLAILLTDILKYKMSSLKGSAQPRDKVKTQIDQANVISGTLAANQLASAVVSLAVNQLGTEFGNGDSSAFEDLLCVEPFVVPFKNLKKDGVPKVNAADSALATLKGIKTMSEICSDDSFCQTRIIDYGVISLLRRLLLRDDYEKLAATEAYNASTDLESGDQSANVPDARDRVPPVAHIRRHAARFLAVLSVHPKVKKMILNDKVWCEWLEECANGKVSGCNDLKTQSYARATLLNIFCNDDDDARDTVNSSVSYKKHRCRHFTEMIYLINPNLPHWKYPVKERRDSAVGTSMEKEKPINPFSEIDEDDLDGDSSPLTKDPVDNTNSRSVSHLDPSLDVVFVHGLRGGPFKSWRFSECKSSSKSGLVEKIDEEAGKQGTFWPAEWLSSDFPHARLFSIKYKTNLTQWSGASLPLQEVSSMLLEKLIAAGIGDRPVVFVTHSMGGLVVKQMLHQARMENRDNLVNNTAGVVFYSCPHFGSKLADLPWRMGFVLRPAPSIGELRRGSPRLVELNDFIRRLHKRGSLDVLSFCETKVTPIVEGYGGWAFRLEIVPIESSYPGYGKLVVLESTDHVNSCKPISKSDPSYNETLQLLHKLRARVDENTYSRCT